MKRNFRFGRMALRPLNFCLPVIARSGATKQSDAVVARASARSNLIHAATYGIASSAFGLLAMTNGAFFKGLTLKVVVVFAFIAVSALPAHAFDAEASRETLKGLTGFYVLIEELNPNIAKYASVQKNNISTQQLKSQVENRLRAAGIRVLSWDEMMKTPERPMLYVSVNTYEYEKFWYACDIRVEVRQLVTLVSQPGKVISGCTWSMNMTGVMNIGQLQMLYNNLGLLLDRFVEAYKKVNEK